MTEVDRLFAGARAGDVKSFERWMGSVELPVRLSLRRFARAVDAEAIVQETLLRMWILARDPEREMVGENASLRFALGVARNLARAEVRKTAHQVTLPPEDLPEIPVAPDPPSSLALRRKILDCIEKLARKPRAALTARLEMGGLVPDNRIAAVLEMTRNTFLQNITRARKQVMTCLERQGVSLREVLT